jgi:DNA polymerase-1
MIALIDMDLVVFRCAASAENEDFEIAKYRANELLDNILIKTESTEYRAFLSSKVNFRKTIYPEYKANRTAEKPRHLRALQDYALEMMSAELADEGYEADDMLGIHQDSDTLTTTICSLDKDLLQVAGKHYQWAIGTSTWSKPDTYIDQSEIEGLRLFYEQCLKGDRSDNIKGIDGIGPKKATKLLVNCSTEKEMFNVVKKEYANDDEFLMNARCLWVLRSDRKDFLNRYKELNN